MTLSSKLFVGALSGFTVSLGGNLIAAWIQQEMNNSFNSARLLIIGLATLLGLIFGAWWDSRGTQGKKGSPNTKTVKRHPSVRLRGNWIADSEVNLDTDSTDLSMDANITKGAKIKIDTRKYPRSDK